MKFRYLEVEITNSKTAYCLNTIICNNRNLQKESKIRIYKSLITKAEIFKIQLETTQMKIARKVANKSLKDHITNDQIMQH